MASHTIARWYDSLITCESNFDFRNPVGTTRGCLLTSTTLIGLAAATFTTVAFVPQALKAWRTRSTKDVSLSMFVLMVTGIVLWLSYGVLLGDLPLIVANVAALGLAAAILACKLRFG